MSLDFLGKWISFIFFTIAAFAFYYDFFCSRKEVTRKIEKDIEKDIKEGIKEKLKRVQTKSLETLYI
jgi:hypothetical protein